jgi:hypothetical protein
MLSLESFEEQRLENPKACCVFYECFYKAAVGEVRWKECMHNSDERIGNDTTEAFALLTLANNYKAWLFGLIMGMPCGPNMTVTVVGRTPS